MITIYAGIIDIDSETGEKSVRDNLFVPVNIPAVILNPEYSQIGGSYLLGQYTFNQAMTGRNGYNILDGEPTNFVTLVRTLYPDLVISSWSDFPVDGSIDISFFIEEDINTQIGMHFKVSQPGSGQRQFNLVDSVHGMFRKLGAFSNQDSFPTSENIQATIVIPYDCRTATSMADLIHILVNNADTNHRSGQYELAPWIERYAPIACCSALKVDGDWRVNGHNAYQLNRGGLGDDSQKSLVTATQWYTFLCGGYIYNDPDFVENPKEPIGFELETPKNGIDKIVFSLPLLDAVKTYIEDGQTYNVSFDQGASTSYTLNAETKLSYALSQWTPGTDLKQLFDFNDDTTQTLLLKNNCRLVLRKRVVTNNGVNVGGYQTPSVLEFWANEKMLGFYSVCQYGSNAIGNDIETGYGIYIVVPSGFAGVSADKWIDRISEDWDNWEFGNCPIALGAYYPVPTGFWQPPGYPQNLIYWDRDNYPNINPPFLYIAFATYLYQNNTYRYSSCSNLPDLESNTADYNFWEGLLAGMPSDTKPYKPGTGSIGGGYSGTGGGQGGYDDTDDGIGDHASPVDLSGMASFMLYAGDIGDIDSLIDYYSNPDYHITDDWRNKIQNAICSTKLYALPTGAHFKTGTDGGIKVGGWSIGDIHMKPVESQYVVMGTGTAETANMLLGTFKIEEYFGSFLDYAPYTKIQIYLPFVGVKDLDVNEIMGRECSLTCTIDLFTGNIVYKLSVENRHTAPGDYDKSVLYTFDGNVAIDIPLGQKDFADKVGMYINTCMSLGGLGLVGASVIATGGATAPLAVVGSAMGTLSALGQQFHEISKASVPKSYIRNGNNTSNNGFSAPNVAFLMITRPKQNIPETFAHEYGFKSHISARLGDLTGFTKVEAIKLEGIPYLDQDELAELEEILKSGIIL